MKRIFGWMLLAIATCSGCALTSKATGPVIATVKDCADKATHDATLSILDDVSAVLLCDANSAESLPGCVVSQLENIAVKWGWNAIDCALADIRSKASMNVAASSDGTEDLRARRATAALAWRASKS